MLSSKDLDKLSAILDNYNNNSKEIREQSENELKQLREQNFGILCLGLLKISSLPNYKVIPKFFKIF